MAHPTRLANVLARPLGSTRPQASRGSARSLRQALADPVAVCSWSSATSASTGRMIVWKSGVATGENYCPNGRGSGGVLDEPAPLAACKLGLHDRPLRAKRVVASLDLNFAIWCADE